MRFLIFFTAYIFAENVKNIALGRAVIHSSSADRNHTGHLTTSGLYKTDSDIYWESKSNQIESLRIDLGVISTFSSVNVCFKGGYANKYIIEVSNDTENWKMVFETGNGVDGENVATFDNTVAAYVRIVFQHSAVGGNYRVSNVEVVGHNEMPPRKPKKMPRRLQNADDGKQYLSSTDSWHLIRAADTNNAKGETISTAAYDVDGWVYAVVPGTVLTSYIENGAVPDPNYSDQFLQISESFHWNNFWYHDVFQVDANQRGKNIWLNFDGINWKADIFLNGRNIGHIDGAFMRGKFDVTGLVRLNNEADPNNYLAVLIYRNDNPGDVHVRTEDSLGYNGGQLGRDNPTFHAAIGWDWIPTIPGRDIGIYNAVYLTFTGALLLVDPWVETRVDFFGEAPIATLTLHADVRHVGAAANVDANVVGTLTPGDYKFTGRVTLGANEEGTVTANLNITNPRLWYPNRYGDQLLYTITITVTEGASAAISDQTAFDFGVRQLEYNKEGNLKIYVNNKRIFCTGGNWGMPEAFMRANTYEDFDIRVRLHKEAGFNCIRNWVGMTGFEDFYRACTKHGILIHEDFWLANPGDGPNPDDRDMFRAAARDKIHVIRKYTSVGFYCGRNEGNPPDPIEGWLHDDTALYDGTRYYVSNSAGDSYGTHLTGGGPYTIQDTDYYFRVGSETFHSERGLPNIPSVESIKEFIPADHLWPTDLIWAQHDFTINSAQQGGHFKDVVKKFGDFNTLEQFVWRAQLAQYEAFKALFEGHSSAHGNGMLLWMSMSCWPSFVWQTFDFFYDTNGGYFGSKAGNQRVNPLFNVQTHELELVNNCGQEYAHLVYEFWSFDLAGQQKNYVTKQLALKDDEVIRQVIPYDLKATTDGNHFIQTRVTNNDTGAVLGENLYWVDTSNKISDYTGLQTIANTTLGVVTVVLPTETSPYGGKINFLNITIENTGKTPAVIVRVKLIKRQSHKRVLPTYYDNNYVTLMPGQKRTIKAEFDDKYLDGEAYDVYYEGFNVAEAQA